MRLRDYFSLSGSFSRTELAIAFVALLAVAVAFPALRQNFPEAVSESGYSWLFPLLYPIWGVALGKRSRDLGTTFTYGMIIGLIFPFMGVVFLFQAGEKYRRSNANKQGGGRQNYKRTRTSGTFIGQKNPLQLAQEFLALMGSGAEPDEIARLFSESMDWEIAGDTGVLPWIGKSSGASAIIDFVKDSRAMLERISFEVHEILAGENRAVILGSLASRVKRTGKVIRTDFAIVLTASNGEIIRFQMLEDSFAVSQAARD
jgi:uncharacterized protein